MRGKNEDLHGNAPDQHPVALVVVDMINDLAFEGGDALLAPALAAADAIADLRRRARAAGVPTVYVNDNHGRWRSDFRRQVDHVLAGTRGAPVAERLLPAEEDYFVLKPKHSGFYATSLELVLAYLGARTLVLTGTATESCILFTAADAYLREFGLVVPPDGVASARPADHDAALGLLGRQLGAALTPAGEVDFEALAREAGGPSRGGGMS
jgi:nicotinamidase-related amidase